MYIVLELQRNGDQAANLVTTFDNYNEAKSKYYLVLSAAAISSVEYHSAFLLSDEDGYLSHETFIHRNDEPPAEE